MKITSDDIYALLRRGEDISVEMKKCSDKLPRSVWETYSAFANSRGGVWDLDDVKEVWLSLPLVRTSKGDEETSKLDVGASKGDSTAVSTENSVENPYAEQENKEKEQVKEQVNLTEKQKEVLIYLLDNPSASLKVCSDATGASAMSIRYTFKKVSGWLDIRHEGPDKTGIWSFRLVGNE